jgi:hypothetical protein
VHYIHALDRGSIEAGRVLAIEAVPGSGAGPGAIPSCYIARMVRTPRTRSIGVAASPEEQVRECLRRLQRRALLVYGVRASAAAMGGGAIAFLVVCALAGAIVTRATAAAGWAFVVLVFLAGLVFFGRDLRRLRRGGAAMLVARDNPILASSLRSAYELAVTGAGHGTSDALRSEHARTAAAGAMNIDPPTVMPWREAARPAAFGGVAVAALSILVIGSSEHLSLGAFALAHPARTRANGELLSDVVRSTRARLSFPAYIGKDPTDVDGAETIEAPIGTHVRYVVAPRGSATRVALTTPDGEVALASRDDGSFVGEFLVTRGGPLEIRMTEDGNRWLVDARRRAIRAIADSAPSVTLEVDPPRAGADVIDIIAFRFRAADDHGIRKIELVVEGPGGETTRETLARPSGQGGKLSSGSHRFSLSSMSVRPGDQVRLWLEATDHDDVGGPNVGRSEVVSVGLPSETSRRAEDLASLQEVLNSALDALADRLEQPVGPSPEEPPSPERHQRVRESTESSKALASSFIESAGERDVLDEADRALVSQYATRVGRGLRAERAAFRGTPTFAKARRADAGLVSTLEEGVISLADVLSRARIQDAAALARELEQLRREMVSLLSELRRAESPEARRALLTAVRRAQARMRDLEARIAAMGNEVPSDFVNRQELPSHETESALEQLASAIERGDLDAAERSLLDLERQIHAMAEALGQAEQDFTEARFGERQRAMAEALEALRGLEVEQHQLARASEDVRRAAAERALRALGSAPQRIAGPLGQNVEAVLSEVESLSRRRLGQADEEAVEQLEARLRDVSAALEQGDVGEAQRMAHSANESAHSLARDLELSALMFPGRDGELRDAATEARRIADRSMRLSAEVDRAIPRFSEHLAENDRQALEANRARQQRAHGAAGSLAERFEGGADTDPLSPETGEGLREVERTMGAASESLEGGDAIAAAERQREAARKLRELREDLEQNRRSQSGGGGGGDGGGLEGVMQPDRRVEIPRAPAENRGVDRRRLVLDGMREEAPSGYERAVRRYYEELLR